MEIIYPIKYVAGTSVKFKWLVECNRGVDFIISFEDWQYNQEEVDYIASFKFIKDIPIEYKYPEI